MSQENWKDIKGYEGFYQVSSLGRVKRLKSTVLGRGGCLRVQPEKILSSRPTQKGYLLLQLSMNSVVKAYTVHRLVAEAFISGDAELSVNHINGIKTDNNVENLEWVTSKENSNHAVKKGLITGTSIKQIDDEKLNQIRALLAEGLSQREISRRLHVSRNTINRHFSK